MPADFLSFAELDLVGMFTYKRQSMFFIDGKNNSEDATLMENKMAKNINDVGRMMLTCLQAECAWKEQQ